MEQPLVSILIPVIGNPTYLELALTSALLQTYTNIEIIIRDPSSTDEIQLLLEKEFLPYSTRITYIRDPQYMSKSQILQELLQLAKGAYINFLMEKDLFYPTKIEKMINYFLTDSTNTLKLITSYREQIDVHGNLVDNFSDIKKSYNNNVHLDGGLIGDFILKNKGYVGGLSSPLFRKKDLIQPFGYFAGESFIKEIEIPSWLTLLSQGSYLLIADELVFERVNTNQHVQRIDMNLITDWIHLIKLAKKNGFLVSKTTTKVVTTRVITWINYLLSNTQSVLTMAEREELLGYKEYLHQLQCIE